MERLPVVRSPKETKQKFSSTYIDRDSPCVVMGQNAIYRRLSSQPMQSQCAYESPEPSNEASPRRVILSKKYHTYRYSSCEKPYEDKNYAIQNRRSSQQNSARISLHPKKVNLRMLKKSMPLEIKTKNYFKLKKARTHDGGKTPKLNNLKTI